MTRMPARWTPDQAARREALRGCSLFSRLSPAELETVLSHATIRRFARGETIMRRSDPATGMAVILQGRLRISITSAEGEETSLSLLGEGEVVGEIALLDGGTRSTDVTAIEDAVLLMIQRSDFLPLLEGSSDLCLRLMQVLCARLRDANRSVQEIATLGLSERLGRVLLRLAGTYGSRNDRELRLALRLSQKDLATLVGASREKVNRQLRLWEQAGALTREGGYMLIRNPDALVAVES